MGASLFPQMLLRMGCHATNHQNRRAFQFEGHGILLHRAQEAAAFALMGQGRIFNHGHRHIRCHAPRQQLLADFAQFSHAHIHHQRGTAMLGPPVGASLLAKVVTDSST